MSEINQSIGWANKKITSARETQQFLREMQQLVDRLREEANSVEESTAHYGGRVAVEVTIKAYYDSISDVPTELVEERDWDKTSISQTATGQRLRLKKKV